MPERVEEKKSVPGDSLLELKSGRWSGMKNEDSEKLVAEILSKGKPPVNALIAGLQELDDGTDWKQRLLLHQLVTQCSVPERKKERAMLADVFAEAALGERPATIRSFLLQQLRYFAEASLAPRLGPLLADKDPLVLDAVTALMVSMGDGASETLEGARKGAQGHAKVAIEHALHQLSS